VGIQRLLIANRGEIASRIIRTCRTLQIETVLTVSEADRDSLPARQADRAICIGPGHASESYLRIETVVQAALGVQADAIHPGYGFLSERAGLARLCEQQGLLFVGPTPEQIDAVGDKLRARSEAAAAGLPLLPGGAIDSVTQGLELGAKIGTPLLVKAVSGGGGRGLRRVDSIADLPAALSLAASEAGAAFGDARVYLERFVQQGRHVEVQVLGDGRGNAIHLGERDCSVQRRYQKLLEETPAPNLSEPLRQRILAAGLSFARYLRYRGAGTVEFLLDAGHDAFYFLEMNARLQVEHPITEAVTGIDLVAEQLAIAGTGVLRLEQADVHRHGCAIECRINAEDPEHDFQPSPGRISSVTWPAGPEIRVDTHIETGSSVPPFYDSLLGKIIAAGRDRATALSRLAAALGAAQVAGVASNLAFQRRLLQDPAFAAGGVDTSFVARVLGRRGEWAQEAADG
jgi:acetyl-CoA carboxylase biotin carboxylase subunit